MRSADRPRLRKKKKKKLKKAERNFERKEKKTGKFFLENRSSTSAPQWGNIKLQMLQIDERQKQTTGICEQLFFNN